MNTLSGREQFSNASAFDIDLPSTANVSEADEAGSAPVACTVLTPTKSCPHMSVNAAQSPNVFTGYPVLTLPSPGGSPHRKLSPSKSPRGGSPRNLYSSASPRKSQLLEGQLYIDQFFSSASSRAVSMPQLSSSPVSEESYSSEIQSYSVSPERKRARPDEVSVSPLLSRNAEHFVKVPAPKDSRSSDISAVGLDRSDSDCSRADMQSKACLFAMATPVETNLVRQSVSVRVLPQTVAMGNTRDPAAKVQLESSKIDSDVSSARCGDDTVTQACTDANAAAAQSPLKWSLPRLQKMRQLWEQNRASVSEKSVKTCASSDVISEASVLQSSSVVSREMNSVVSGDEASSAVLCATSFATAAEVYTNTTVASSQISSTTANSKISDTAACKQLETCHADQQTVVDRSIECDSFKAVSVPAAKTDVSNDVHDQTGPTSADGKMGNTAVSKCTNSIETISVSAANDVMPNYLSGDRQMDVDDYTLEDSDEFSFAPVESKPFFIL